MGKKWTLEALFKEALKYNSRGEFRQKSPSAYTVAHRDDVMEQICAHMQLHRRRKTNEEIQQDALKCRSKKEFYKKYRQSYAAAHRLRIIDKVCAHMPKRVNQSGQNGPNFKYTNERLTEIASRYENRAAFRKANDGAYQIARNRGILEQICAHMPKHIDQSGKNNPSFKYTDENMNEIASGYKTRTQFKKGNSSVYAIALKRGILGKICSHMPKHVDKSGENCATFKWTDKLIKDTALHYETRSEFKTPYSGAYKAARNRGILEQICSHMKKCGGISLSERHLLNLIKEI